VVYASAADAIEAVLPAGREEAALSDIRPNLHAHFDELFVSTAEAGGNGGGQVSSPAHHLADAALARRSRRSGCHHRATFSL
jgi:hypothetical protein